MRLIHYEYFYDFAGYHWLQNDCAGIPRGTSPNYNTQVASSDDCIIVPEM